MRWLQFNTTRYSWLNHKEGDDFARDARGIDDGYSDSEGRFEDNNKHSGFKPSLFVSLLLNGSLVLLVAILWWRDRRLHSRNSDLLPTPVPECMFAVMGSYKVLKLIFEISSHRSQNFPARSLVFVAAVRREQHCMGVSTGS